jgi:hypothetical protein
MRHLSEKPSKRLKFWETALPRAEAPGLMGLRMYGR